MSFISTFIEQWRIHDYFPDWQGVNPEDGGGGRGRQPLYLAKSFQIAARKWKKLDPPVLNFHSFIYIRKVIYLRVGCDRTFNHIYSV